jgi:SPP1 gp7 family putative phage head morphogenesis protein
MSAEFLFEPAPYEDAVEFLKSKPAMLRSVFDRLLPDIKARAFCITGIEATDVLQNVRDTVATLPAGADWNKIKRTIANEISPYFVDQNADADTQKKQAYGAERRAELLIRTHGQQAYAAGTYAMLDDQRDFFPYWQYLTLGDDHVRDTHAALDKIILPADHEFWQLHYPPWDWGCRCTVAPISAHDYKKQVDRDASKPPDKRDTLDLAEQDELTLTRRIVRNGVAYNVSAPSETGKEGAFKWHPGDLRLPLAQLKNRYDATSWAFFEQFAKKTAVEKGSNTTVWEWLEGKKIETGNLKPETGNGKPVGDALHVTTTGKHREIMRHAVEQIAKVHWDGLLPKITVDGRTTDNALGEFVRHLRAGAKRIGVNGDGPWPHLTAIHEIGHFLDLSGLGDGLKFATSVSHDMAPWQSAVLRSQAIANLRADLSITSKESDYFLSPVELWARSYAQYIAVKTGDQALREEIAIARGHKAWRQWTPKDFKPIMKEIDKLFKQKGWL